MTEQSEQNGTKIINEDETQNNQSENSTTLTPTAEENQNKPENEEIALQESIKKAKSINLPILNIGLDDFIELLSTSKNIFQSILRFNDRGQSNLTIFQSEFSNQNFNLEEIFNLAQFSNNNYSSNIIEYLPFWLTLINENGFSTLASISFSLTNSPPAPLTFEMTASEPNYSILSPITSGGTTGDDIINGLIAENNVIDGLDGNDTITGGNLGDEIWGGDGDDILNGGDGDDRILGSTGDDQASGGDGDDWIWGGDGVDDIIGNAGDDFLSGNAGDDTIFGSIGSDTIYGGEDDDTIYALDNNSNNKSDLTFENLIFGDDGDDIIFGSSGQDTLNGGNGNDTINSRSESGDNYEDYIMALNPIVYYRLGEASGSTTAIDRAGNMDATYASGIKLAQDGFNNTLEDTAVKFSGADDQVVLSADDALFDTTEGTVSAWFNVDNTDDEYAVFSKDGNGNVDGQFFVGVDSNGDIYGRLQQGGVDSNFNFDPTAAIGGKIQADQWYMLTMTYGAGGADFYVNGQLVGSDGLLTQTNSSRGFMIGGQNSTSSARDVFQGSIDEVFWLPDELDATEVNNLYTAGTGATLDTQNTTEMIGGDGNDTLNGSDGLDELYGGDGLDQLLGGGGADQFIFEVESAFNDVDVINDFNENEGDAIDIADILSGINVNAGNISDYVDINIDGDDSYFDYVMAQNPLVYYRLDETSGDYARDSAGNVDGLYRNAPTQGQSGFNAGISNDAAYFDGSADQLVEINDNSIFDTNQGTVSTWFNVDNTASDYAVFAKDGNGSVDGQFYIGVDSNGDIYGRVQQGGTSSSFTFDPAAAIGGKVQAGQWYMLTMTYDAGGANFYINGQLLGSDGLLTQTNSDRSLLIGAQNSSGIRDEFQGSIDEFTWFADSMDAAAVNNLYNAGITATDNIGVNNGVFVDINGTGTFNAGNQIASFADLTNVSDELTMLNNNNLVI